MSGTKVVWMTENSGYDIVSSSGFKDHTKGPQESVPNYFPNNSNSADKFTQKWKKHVVVIIFVTDDVINSFVDIFNKTSIVYPKFRPMVS